MKKSAGIPAAFVDRGSLAAGEAGCPSGELPNGQFTALTVAVADVDLVSTSCPAGNFEIVPHVLLLEVATAGYYPENPDSMNQPIVPGMTFPILNQHVSDEDLCGNVPAGAPRPLGIAMLNECPNGSPCSAISFASSGSITVVRVVRHDHVSLTAHRRTLHPVTA